MKKTVLWIIALIVCVVLSWGFSYDQPTIITNVLLLIIALELAELLKRKK